MDFIKSIRDKENREAIANVIAHMYTELDARSYGIDVAKFGMKALEIFGEVYTEVGNVDQFMQKDENGFLTGIDFQKMHESVEKSTELIWKRMKEWVNEFQQAAQKSGEEREAQSRVPGEGKRCFRNMGYYQIMYDKRTGAISFNGVELYRAEKEGPEGENGVDNDRYDFVYYMPINGPCADDFSDVVKTAKYSQFDEDTTVGEGKFGVLLAETKTFGDASEEEQAAVRKFVEDVEKSYYTCFAYETDARIVTFMRLRNLYCGLLDEDQMIEEAERAAKAMEGNLKLASIEGFDADSLVEVLKPRMGDIIEEMRNNEERWV